MATLGCASLEGLAGTPGADAGDVTDGDSSHDGDVGTSQDASADAGTSADAASDVGLDAKPDGGDAASDAPSDAPADASKDGGSDTGTADASDSGTLTATALGSGRINNTACAMTSGGMYCWGDNTAGQFGNGLTQSSNVPLLSGVPTSATNVFLDGTSGEAINGAKLIKWGPDLSIFVGLNGVTDACIGEIHQCAVANGSVYCWGDNTDGELGTGDNQPRVSPTVVSLGGTASAVACGKFHSCAVVATIGPPTVKCWGGNPAGQLGTGGTTPSLTPVDVAGTAGAGKIKAGTNFTCAVINGAASCWGSINSANVPTAIGGALAAATALAAGAQHACAAIAGAAMCWGVNASGQLGDLSAGHASAGQPIGLATGVTDVATGEGHSCAIQNGRVKCWGRGTLGQTGDGTGGTSPVPVTVKGF
jgi:alpha-tubulin suppressor-like RCC1 family protein